MEPAVWRRKVNVFIIGMVIVLLLKQKLFDGGDYEGIIIFSLSALSLIPLAGFLESAVEELAELWGPFFGGLLHTTASNIAELTISLALLFSIPVTSDISATNVVTNSIAGVIIRNSLLFLGLATFIGCMKNGKMKFDASNAGEYSTIFTLAVIGVGLPTLGSFLQGPDANASTITLTLAGHSVPLTVLLAVVLLAIYVAYIGFVLRGRVGMAEHEGEHGHHEFALDQLPNLLPEQSNAGALFAEERERAVQEEHGQVAAKGRKHLAPTYGKAKHLKAKQERRKQRNERRIFEDHPRLRGLVAIVVLAVSTGLVALMSEAFAGSVEEVFHNHPTILGQPTETLEFFLGLIFIPLLAGMVELYGSVGEARENNMEITIAITAGATIQMILLVVPVIILVGFFTGHPLNLVFTPITVIVFGAATFTFMLLSRDGESSVLEGAQLCALWLLIAIIALFLPPPLG